MCCCDLPTALQCGQSHRLLWQRRLRRWRVFARLAFIVGGVRFAQAFCTFCTNLHYLFRSHETNSTTLLIIHNVRKAIHFDFQRKMSFALAHLKGKVVLASASPRRVEMLRDMLGLSPHVVPSTFTEDLEKDGITPAEYCSATARAKCAEVSQRRSITAPYLLVVSADSIVVSPDGVIFEKASDAAEASQMMRSLSGRTHVVITAVCMARSRGGSG